MVEILEIGLEDAFWTIFVTLLSIALINHIKGFEEAIPELASESCYVSLLNKGLWSICSHEPMSLSLAYFESFNLKSKITRDYVLIEVTGFSKEYKLPFTAMEAILTPGNYQILWNGSLILVRT